MSEIKQIIKRDGRTVDFDISKISDAIYKAAEVLGGQDRDTSNYLARQVELYLVEVLHNEIPTVEQIQDAVEKVLIENGHARTAKEFILYRAERTRVRDMNTRLMKTYEDLTFKDAKDTPAWKASLGPITPLVVRVPGSPRPWGPHRGSES